MQFLQIFEKICARFDLTVEESREAAFAMMDGEWEISQISALLTALHLKGETAQELAGFASAMCERAVRIPSNGIRVMDTCGTGGDRKGSFNISTVSAFVLAGCGIRIAKHGNRSASSSCGSADLFAALGMRYRLDPAEAAEAIEAMGFAFLFAPDYHPATKLVAGVRKQLGVPTIFNLLGPLTNPVRPAAQLIGVYSRRGLELMAHAIRLIDAERRAMLLHGEAGWDEATACCPFVCQTTYSEARVRTAEEFGFRVCSESDLRGGAPEENAKITLSILNGERNAKRDAVVLNALLGYMVYHPDATAEKAREAAEESIDSRAALNVMKKYKERFPLTV